MDETPLQKWQREEAAKKEQFRLSHPNHRLITRGSRKGQMVRLTRAEKSNERRVQRERQKQDPPLGIPNTSRPSSPQMDASTSTDHWNFFFFLLLSFALPLGSYFVLSEVAKGLRYLKVLPLLTPLIFLDFIAWRLIAKAKPRTKYLPIVWWIFGRA
jgi:hypothetical protein